MIGYWVAASCLILDNNNNGDNDNNNNNINRISNNHKNDFNMVGGGDGVIIVVRSVCFGYLLRLCFIICHPLMEQKNFGNVYVRRADVKYHSNVDMYWFILKAVLQQLALAGYLSYT